MPRNQFQRMIFALLTVIITVHGYVFYSLYVVNGKLLMEITGADSVLGAIRAQGGVYMFGRMLPIWAVVIVEFCFAYALECLVGSPMSLLMCDKEAIEVQKILPFLSDTWPLCRIGRAVIRASQSCRQSCNKSQCPACGCRSHHSCTHAPQFSRSFPAREWGSVLQRQGACGQCP